MVCPQLLFLDPEGKKEKLNKTTLNMAFTVFE
jgi:hypothetical protein